MSKILQVSDYRNRKLQIKPSILIKISKIARIVTVVFVLSLLVLLLCKVIKFKAKHFIMTIDEERKILKSASHIHGEMGGVMLLYKTCVGILSFISNSRLDSAAGNFLLNVQRESIKKFIPKIKRTS